MGQSSSRPSPPAANQSQQQQEQPPPSPPPPPPPTQPRRRARPVSGIFDSYHRRHIGGADIPRSLFHRSSRLNPDRPEISRSESFRQRQIEDARRHPHAARRIYEPGHPARPAHFGRRLLARLRHEEVPLTYQAWAEETQFNPPPRDSLEMTRAARHNSTPSHERAQEVPDSESERPLPPVRPPSPHPNRSWPQPIPRSPRIDQNMVDRIHGLTPAREFGSRLTASIRRRRARPNPNEDNAAMLQRLLSVAAAATAASLMGGNPESAVNDLRRAAVPVDTEDGSFDNFLQALRNGRLASHLGRAGDDGGNVGSNDSNSNSLDFFRMFRFGPNRTTNSGRQSDIAEEDGNGNEELRTNQNENDAEGRTVSILIVGIRSLNSENDTQPDQADTMPSFIDALTNLNTTINVGLQDQTSNSSLRASRSNFGRSSSVFNRRRASMGGLFTGRNPFSPGPEITRPLSEIGPPTARSVTPEIQEPTPTSQPDQISNAPRAAAEPQEEDVTAPSSSMPPSRPRSRLRDSWPSRNSWRNSWTPSFTSRSRADPLGSTNRHSMVGSMPEEEDDDHNHPPPRRNRPRSEGEFLRFGSGSSRRNGIVEPDHNTQEGNRSWIIYVLGGNYPEDHPILTTPSLFTDNPTYEDMLLLSSLLGPAKPPVAQQEDVDASGGLFFLKPNQDNSLELIAREISPSTLGALPETFTIEPRQACQVCLVEYAGSELLRRLHTCRHFFHRACIDQVSLKLCSCRLMLN